MMNPQNAELLSTSSPSQWLAYERDHRRYEHFEVLDALLSSLWMRFWQGERLVETSFPKGESPKVRLTDLDAAQHQFVTETFALHAQQSRGALFHPTKDRIIPGLVNFGWYQATITQYAFGAAGEERGSMELSGEGDALALWAMIESLFSPLAIPFSIRSGVSSYSEESIQAKWAEFETYLTICGFKLGDELTAFKPSKDGDRLWAGWKMAQQIEARQSLWSAMSAQANPEMAVSLRIEKLREFVEHYSKKTAKGPNIRKKVLNKAMERSLCGLFGGDWLRALEYLGEAPHEEEAIVTAVPTPKIYVGMEARVAEVASQTGLPEAEVRLMVEGFWDGTTGVSPVEKRVQCLERYWAEFENLHDNQRPGMTPLWGLVADYKGLDLPHESPVIPNTATPSEGVEGQDSEEFDYSRPIPHLPGLYREKFSVALQSEIESLWGTSLLPRYPERLVTNLNPHYSLAEALGAALRFWHGCSLTAWFICEGPYSRTSIDGMSSYYRKLLDELVRVGTPVDEALFTDLKKAESQLGPEIPIVSRETKTEYLTMTISHGARRDGFESLRDVIANHRRQWTQSYLPQYLEQRWKAEVQTVGAAYMHQLHDKGKAPTAKSFAKTAQHVTNNWFGGDLSGLFRTIGEKSTVNPVYERRMPKDMVPFALAVRARLTNHEVLRGLRDEPAQFVQLEEALGRLPDVKEFVSGKTGWVASHFRNDARLWNQFVDAIETENVICGVGRESSVSNVSER